MSDYKCNNCQDTGERGQQGMLDCMALGCTAAVDRAALNAFVKQLGPVTEYDLVWAVHQRAVKLATQTMRIDNKPQPPTPNPERRASPTGRFQHFDSEEAWQRHLREVAEAQKNDNTPF